MLDCQSVRCCLEAPWSGDTTRFTQAAIRAGYSKRTAARIGSENLHKPPIASRIAELVGERNERVKVEADWVLRRLVELWKADIAHLFDANGQLRAFADMPDGVSRLIAAWDAIPGEGGGWIRKIRFLDRLRVLELIGKHVDVSAFRENVSHGVSDDLLERMERARRRASQR